MGQELVVETNGDKMRWSLLHQDTNVYVSMLDENGNQKTDQWIVGNRTFKSLEPGNYQMQYGGQWSFLLYLSERCGGLTYRGTQPEIDSLRLKDNKINWDVEGIKLVYHKDFGVINPDSPLESRLWNVESYDLTDSQSKKIKGNRYKTKIKLMKGARFLMTASLNGINGAGLFRVAANGRLKKIVHALRDPVTGEFARVCETEDAFYAGQPRQKPPKNDEKELKFTQPRIILNSSFWVEEPD